ncbi:MAG: quercetin 2,3-dioxygenase [Phycisphaerae bacterium]|nr:MAG: quercetin 2,3-dioxygenase [Phycisphaerae bacterium]
MITVRKAEDRGTFDFGWLRTAHTFSFGEYHDPAHMGFSVLRVINDDVVAPGQGFGEHPHRDMEIITVVLDGALRHRDSSGGGGVIRPGDVQRMSAGRGVFHSEFNDSSTDHVHLYQVWIRPAVRGVEPRYEQKHFPIESRRDQLRLVVSPDGRDGSIPIHQDASLYRSVLGKGSRVRHELATGRKAWVQAAAGSVTVNGQPLREGDGAAIEGETVVEIVAPGEAEVLMFDLP